MIDRGRRDSLRNVLFFRSQRSPRRSPPANGGAKACPAPDGFRGQNRREKTRSAQLPLQTRGGRHGQSNGGSASPRCIVSNLRAIGVFSLFPDELPNCAGQLHPAHVRNIVGVHFVPFTGRQKKTHRERLSFWCPGPESNRHDAFRHRRILSPLCLPVSPPGQLVRLPGCTDASINFEDCKVIDRDPGGWARCLCFLGKHRASSSGSSLSHAQLIPDEP